MSLDAPGIVMRSLAALEDDLAQRQNGHETDSDRLTHLDARWELTLAQTMLTVAESNAERRKAKALTMAVAANPELYQELMELRARVAGTKSVMAVLERRASALQSILRAQTRIDPQMWQTAA